MDTSRTRRLISCSNAAEAHIIKGMLESQGISCAIHNENNLFGGIVAVGCTGVDLYVYEDEYDRAKELLDAPTEAPEE